MTTPAWPSDLPWTCDQNTLEEVDADVLVRWNTDFGLEKLRRRTAMFIPTLRYQKTFLLSQWDELMFFYRSTCLNGTLAFTTFHPRTGVAISAQFTSIPQMKSMDSHLSGIASIELTVLPTNAA